MEKMNVAILGASGYTGAEAVRLILQHPKLNLVALTGHSKAGQRYEEAYPQFAGFGLPGLQAWQDVNWDSIDTVFACLPHGASQDTIAQLQGQVPLIIDLSADFRLKSPDLYAATYGRPHDSQDMLKTAVYGLSEYNRSALKDASLVACPGCYPTCTLLGLLPILQSGMASDDHIVVDAKSGITGAGRKVSQGLLYSELADGAHPYGIGTHRHSPEIGQGMKQFAKTKTAFSFTPHLVPMNRGMISTIYVGLRNDVQVEDVRSAYQSHYADDSFIKVLNDGVVPQTRHVRGSNYCHIGIFKDRVENRVIIVSVIDNLTKGSSGQAVQNLNIVQGWDETLGLGTPALFP